MDAVFPSNHVKLFNGILARANLKFDRDGKPRTAYSLRHTFICMRLMEGADIDGEDLDFKRVVQEQLQAVPALVATTSIGPLTPSNPVTRSNRASS